MWGAADAAPHTLSDQDMRERFFFFFARATFAAATCWPFAASEARPWLRRAWLDRPLEVADTWLPADWPTAGAAGAATAAPIPAVAPWACT